MDRKIWEEKFDNQLSVDFQNTSESDYKNESEFRDDMYERFMDSCNEQAILSYEDRKWMSNY